MVTGTDSLLAHQRRGGLAREIDSGRLARKLRASGRPGRGRRWAFLPPRGIEATAGPPASPKIRRLHDAGVPTRT